MADSSHRSVSYGPTLGDLLAQPDADLFVGRDEELAVFDAWLTQASGLPRLLHVWGPGGIGKSALLRLFQRRARALNRPVLAIEVREILATPEALLDALGGGPLVRATAELNARQPLLVIDTLD